MRRALHDPGLRLCLLARPNQGRQDRLYLFELDHPGSWRRHRLTSCRTSGFTECPSKGLLRTTGCGRQDRFSDRVRTGEARRPSWVIVPHAAHARGDTVRLGADARAFLRGKHSITRRGFAARSNCARTFAGDRGLPGFPATAVSERNATGSGSRRSVVRCFHGPGGRRFASRPGARTAVIACASGFTSSRCRRSACSGSVQRQFVCNAAARIRPRSSWAFVPEPAATGAAYTSFGGRRRGAASRSGRRPRARSRRRCDSSFLGCGAHFATCRFAAGRGAARTRSGTQYHGARELGEASAGSSPQLPGGTLFRVRV